MLTLSQFYESIFSCKTYKLSLDAEQTTTGVVEAATRGNTPQVQVNGMFYDMNKIKAVYGF